MEYIEYTYKKYISNSIDAIIIKLIYFYYDRWIDR